MFKLGALELKSQELRLKLIKYDKDLGQYVKSLIIRNRVHSRFILILLQVIKSI